MEHHAYESAQHTNEEVGDAVVRELILLVDSCFEHLLARRRYDLVQTEDTRLLLERTRTLYGHKLMTVLGDDATDEAIDALSGIVEEVARKELEGTGVADNGYICDAMDVLRGQTE